MLTIVGLMNEHALSRSRVGATRGRFLVMPPRKCLRTRRGGRGVVDGRGRLRRPSSCAGLKSTHPGDASVPTHRPRFSPAPTRAKVLPRHHHKKPTCESTSHAPTRRTCFSIGLIKILPFAVSRWPQARRVRRPRLLYTLRCSRYRHVSVPSDPIPTRTRSPRG